MAEVLYHYERRGRSARTIAALVAVWAGLVLIWLGLGASVWVIGGLALFTLPALWDVLRDSRSTLTLSDGQIAWDAAFSSGVRCDVDHVRLNRRFDGSMKVHLVHIGGATTRLPPDVVPPVDAFEAALAQAGLPAQRHPFLPF